MLIFIVVFPYQPVLFMLFLGLCDSQQTCLTLLSELFACLTQKKILVARSPAGSPGETAGKAAAAVGKEVRPGAYGRFTASSLHNAIVTLCRLESQTQTNQPVAVPCPSVTSASSVPCGKALGLARCATVPVELSATFTC